MSHTTDVSPGDQVGAVRHCRFMGRHATAMLLMTLGLAPLGCTRPIDSAGIEAPSPCAERGVHACEAECEAGDGAACLMASVAHGAKSREKMLAYELRACERGVAQGCGFYGNNFGKSDRPLARQYHERACSGGYGMSCLRLIQDALGPGDDGDTKTMRDAVAAREVWASQCERNALACSGLADLEALGIGGPRDREAAREHYTVGCRAGQAQACRNLGANESEVWLHPANYRMFELLSVPSPRLVFNGVVPGHRLTSGAAACFEQGSVVPVRAYSTRPSGSESVDAAVVETVRGWRIRARRPFPGDATACVSMTFSFSLNENTRLRFGNWHTER